MHDTHHFRSMCRAAIEKLRTQNNMLKEELLMENKFSVAPTNHSINAQINRCQDQLDLYTRKVAARIPSPPSQTCTNAAPDVTTGPVPSLPLSS